ncbi:NAD-binding protein [Kitasatospora sp. NA04385]|uniref:NAD-binding protein n=1 Tax=Kitasatospora sp. NA04385 TaxID=2742135 RepID=UPI001591BD15|nr:NAD(P)-binding protein [Kitasatospora sp. NA04385]QKW22624.1 NAD-binding protein [Kitasatospora sp. NA04385]
MTDQGRGSPEGGTEPTGAAEAVGAAEAAGAVVGGHYIVCGGNSLAYRLILELTEQYEVPVVAVVPDRSREHGPAIARIPGVRAVLEHAAVTGEALGAADVGHARGIALMDGTDQENIHAALAAENRNPGVRIVLRIFNQRLGEHLEKLLPNCAALSGSATAAPAFANGALSRPHTVEVGGRQLYVAYDAEIRSDQVCLVADRIDRQDLTRLRLLPGTGGRAADFIRIAEFLGGGEGVVPRGRPDLAPAAEPGGLAALQTLDTEQPLRPPLRKRLKWWLLDGLKHFTNTRLRMILITAFVAILLGGLVLARHTTHSGGFGWTVYFTLLDAAGAVQPDVPGQVLGDSWARAAQVLITFCGITFVPVATAIVVEALASGRRGVPRPPGARTRDHVIVVGLGNVGTRVATLVHGTGLPVVCLERDPQARGIAAARALGIPVLIGEGPLEAQLKQARVKHARAVVAVTSDDAANLEAALEARAVRPEVRIVVRLFDDDFAHHVYATLGNVASRSVSYLAAPAFAAALMGREVLGTLSVFRHVLLIAELTVEEGSGLDGRNTGDLEGPGGVRVLAVRLHRRPQDYQWNFADRSRRLLPGDRIVVAATRAGLARVIQ